MTTRLSSKENEPEVGSREELVAYLESGCKPPAQWRIGTEHEKFMFDRETHAPLPYEGEKSVRAFLEGLQRFGWEPILESGRPVALKRDDAAVTLEPAGQLELSGAPVETIQQSCAEVNGHLAEVREVADALGVGLLGLGFHPTATRDEMPWMPKARYGIMGRYMPRVGTLGLDMMTRSCGVQVNLDFESEADLVRKFRVGLALQPVATALFANSPFVEGRPSGWLSYRAHVWSDTDADRCGMVPFVFESGMGFERYTDYALDVPMYFVQRGSELIDVSGKSFRDFLDGRLDALPGERPRLSDWEDHLTTLFPEVRMKRIIEMRGTDSGPWGRLCALPALWTGLLYDSRALDDAWHLVRDWTVEERETLWLEAPRTGLATPFRSGTLQEVAKEAVAIAREGLSRRARRGECGRDEVHFIDELLERAESGRTPADDLLDRYENVWGRQLEPLFKEAAY